MKKGIKKFLSLFMAAAAVAAPIQAKNTTDIATKEDLINVYFNSMSNHYSSKAFDMLFENVVFDGYTPTSDAEKLAMYTGLVDRPDKEDLNAPLTRGDLIYCMGKTMLNPSRAALDTGMGSGIYYVENAKVTDLSLISPTKQSIVGHFARLGSEGLFSLKTGVPTSGTKSITVDVNKPVTLGELTNTVNHTLDFTTDYKQPEILVKGLLKPRPEAQYTISENTVTITGVGNSTIDTVYSTISSSLFRDANIAYIEQYSSAVESHEASAADANLLPDFHGSAYHTPYSYVKTMMSGAKKDYTVGDGFCGVSLNGDGYISKYTIDYTKAVPDLEAYEQAYSR